LIDAFEQVDCIMIPGPPQVVRKFGKRIKTLRKFGFNKNALEFSAVLGKIADHKFAVFNEGMCWMRFF